MKKVVLYVLGAILVVAAAVGIWQRENLKALVISRSYSSEQLQEKKAENDSEIDSLIEEDPDIDITKLTEEQREELRTGEMTEAQAVKIVLEKTAAENTPAASDPAALQAKKHRINELVAEVYVMRDSYVAKLNTIESAGKSKYSALPAEQKTKSARNKIISECISQASSLEGQCDSKMDGILSELSKLLNETGGDTTLVGRIKGTYAEQKAITKAQYIN